MAFVSSTSTLRFDGAAGAFRQWQAVAATQDTAEGGNVVVTTTITSGGVAPTAHTALNVRVKNSSGTIIADFSLGVGAGPFSSTFHFTDTGAGGGAARHGTCYIDIQATKTGGLDAYDYETDGAPSTAPTGFSAGTVDRGWIRGTTTLVEDVSNVGLGGAEDEPAAYDESLFFRATLGSASYTAYALTVASSSGSLSSATASATTTTRDVTFANVCDERFPAASTVVSWTVTAPNDANTGAAVTTFSSTTDDTITVDPRLTCTHHFQIDNNTFTLASDDNTNQMLSTQSGFLWTIIKNARGTGINGITVAQTLTPTNPGTAVSDTPAATTTQDGQIGVGARLDWTASKPGGTWTKAVDVTAPTDIDGATYLTSSTDTLTMLSADPRVRVIVGGGNLAALDGLFAPGDALTVGLSCLRSKTRIDSDVGTASVAVFRMNGVLGRAEYWSGSAWSFGDSPTFHALTSSAGDAKLEITTFSGADTASWGYHDLFLVGYVEIDGTPYSGPGHIDVAAASGGSSTRDLSVGSMA